MTINLSVPTTVHSQELKPRITVIGVGGAGGNAVNNMIQSGLEGVEFLVANSDAQALAHSHSDHRIQMGINATHGLGAGSNPEIGRAAAEESLEEIMAQLQDVNMVFITAGLGGGTGTGGAPVIARAARERGILTVGVVTKPFQFEGANRMRLAEAGLEELQQYVDTLLIIPNQNLFRVANEKTTFADAFKMADDVLYSGVRGVTDLMVMPGLINLDFADIRAVMSEMGKAMMGTGEAEGERRAVEAAEAAIANPLLDDTSMKGAKGVLINITAGPDITLFEVDEAANRIRDEVDEDANIIFGSTFDDSLEGRIRVSVVATGIEANAGIRPQPLIRHVTEAPKPAQLSAPESVDELDEAPAEVALFPAQESTQEVAQEAVMEATAPEAPAAMPAMASETSEPAHAGFESDPEPAGEMEPAAIAEPELQATGTDSAMPVQASGAMDQATAEAAPVAPPKAAPAEAPFIPRAPVRVSAAPAPEAKPDPFAAADMVNAQSAEPAAEQPAPAKKRGPSLFERVTGVARGERRDPVMPSMSSRPAGDSAARADIPRKPASEAVQDETPKPATPAKTLLGALNASDTGAESAEDEDLLDIPAFLRRQAN